MPGGNTDLKHKPTIRAAFRNSGKYEKYAGGTTTAQTRLASLIHVWPVPGSASTENGDDTPPKTKDGSGPKIR